MSLRSQLEQRIRELEGELGRARSTQQDSLKQKDSIRTELEQYRQLYTEEMRLRKSLTAKLERLEWCYSQLTIPVALHRPESNKSNKRQLGGSISEEVMLLIWGSFWIQTKKCDGPDRFTPIHTVIACGQTCHLWTRLKKTLTPDLQGVCPCLAAKHRGTLRSCAGNASLCNKPVINVEVRAK